MGRNAQPPVPKCLTRWWPDLRWRFSENLPLNSNDYDVWHAKNRSLKIKIWERNALYFSGYNWSITIGDRDLVCGKEQTVAQCSHRARQRADALASALRRAGCDNLR